MRSAAVLLALVAGCGGVPGAEALVADTPLELPTAWVCPTARGTCGENPLDLSPDSAPSDPAKATEPNPAAEGTPELVDAGVSTLGFFEVRLPVASA